MCMAAWAMLVMWLHKHIQPYAHPAYLLPAFPVSHQCDTLLSRERLISLCIHPQREATTMGPSWKIDVKRNIIQGRGRGTQGGWDDWSSACGHGISNCLCPFPIFHSHQTSQGDVSTTKRGQIHTDLSFYHFLFRNFLPIYVFTELVRAQ